MTDPVRTIAERVRTRVLREGVDLGVDGAAATRFAHEEVRHYSERALAGAHAQLGDEARTARDVLAAITGYGPLQPFFDDSTVEEIWINSPTRVFIARYGVPDVARLVRAGWIDVVFAGNGFATHDMESNVLGTSLGVSVAEGTPTEGGHSNHLRVINEIRRHGWG